jgi:hypothetical protein
LRYKFFKKLLERDFSAAFFYFTPQKKAKKSPFHPHSRKDKVRIPKKCIFNVKPFGFSELSLSEISSVKSTQNFINFKHN